MSSFYEYPDYLCHYGVKGQKWGVRRYQDADGALTAAGKKRLRQLNKLDEKDNRDRYNRELAKKNVEMFGNKKDPVSKLLTKLNKTHISNFEKSIEQNKEKIDSIIKDMKSQKVELVLRYDPWSDKIYYKQSDKQATQAKDNKLYRKEGIQITRDDQGRIVSARGENVDRKTIRRINDITMKGYY